MGRTGVPVSVRVLGAVAVATGGQGVTLAGARLSALLVRLVVAGGRPVSSWQLREDVWPGGATSDSTVRVAIGRLRSALGDDGADPQLLRREGDGYLLDLDRLWLDVVEMQSLVAAARRSSSDPARALALYQEGLDLWRGPPFGELADAPFARAEVDRLLSLHEAVIEERFDAAIAAGGGPELIGEMEAAVADQPLRERRTGALMVALYRAGRQADALSAYRRLEATLREDLGLIPSDDLRRLEVKIVSQDPALLGIVEARRSSVLAERATSGARAAVSLARHGAFSEADRVSRAAVTDARDCGDPLVLNRCLVNRARTIAVDGQLDEARTAIEEAAGIARHAGDGTGLAEVAMVRFGFGLAEDDNLLVGLVEPLELLTPDAPRRVELLCAAMHQVALTGSLSSAERLVKEAVTIAERTGDERARAVACVGEAVLASLRRQPSQTVLDLTEEALAAAEESGDPVLVVAGLHAAVRELMCAGDIDGVEALLPRFDGAAASSLLPFALVRSRLLRTSIALARGQLGGVEAMIDDAAAAGSRLGVSSSVGSTAAQRVLYLLERGCHDAAASLLALGGGRRSWLAASSLVFAEAGRAGEARGMLEQVFADGTQPSNEDRVMIGMCAGEAAWSAGWDDTAQIESLLRPQRGRCSIVGHATITLGPVDRVLGLLALADGRIDDAVEHLWSAVDVAGSATVWAERSRVGLVHALAVRGTAADLADAAALLHRVEQSPLLTEHSSSWLRSQHERAGRALARATAR